MLKASLTIECNYKNNKKSLLYNKRQHRKHTEDIPSGLNKIVDCKLNSEDKTQNIPHLLR